MSSAIRSVLWLLASNGASKILWALSLIFLMRLLGPESYGALVTIWAFGGLVASVSDLGVGQVMVREGSCEMQSLRPYLVSATLVKLVLLVPTWAGVVLGCLIWLLPPSDATSGWFLVLALAAATPLIDHFQTVFSQATQVMHRLDIFAIWRTAYFALLLVVFWLLLGEVDVLLPVSVLYFAVTLVFTMLFGWHVWRLLPPSSSRVMGLRSVRQAMAQGLPFVVTMLLAMAYYRVDVLLLGFLGSNEEAGIYSAQYQIIILLYSISGILFTVIFPDLYRNTHDHAYMQQRFVYITRYLNIMAWLTTPVLYTYAQDIMTDIGGGSFAKRHQGLQILALMMPLYLSAVALNFLTAFDRLRARIWCELAALAITLVGGALAIPHLSVAGMALVADIAYGFSGAAAVYILAKDHRIDIRPVLHDLVRLTAAIAPAMLVLIVPFSRWWQGAAAFMLVSLLSLTISRFWDAHDRALFLETCKLLRIPVHGRQE